MVNDANVTTADVTSSNGVIHVIDKVLMPTATPNDIPRTAQCTGIHDTLVLQLFSDLLETLQKVHLQSLHQQTKHLLTQESTFQQSANPTLQTS